MIKPLSPKFTSANGVTIEIKETDAGALVVAMSGGSLAPLLQLANLSSLDLETDLVNLQKLASLIQGACQMKSLLLRIN